MLLPYNTPGKPNPVYTVFCVEEPRNHFFLLKNVYVQYQKKMQLELNLLIPFHTDSSLCKKLIHFLYKQNKFIWLQRNHTFQLILDNDKKSLCLAILTLLCHAYVC